MCWKFQCGVQLWNRPRLLQVPEVVKSKWDASWEECLSSIILHPHLPLLWCVCLRKGEGGTRGAGADKHTLTKTHTAFRLLMKSTKRQNIKMHNHTQPLGLSFRLPMQYFWVHGCRLKCIYHIARKALMTYNNGSSFTAEHLLKSEVF